MDRQLIDKTINRQTINRQDYEQTRQSIDKTTHRQTRNRQYQTINRHTQKTKLSTIYEVDSIQTGQEIDGQEIDKLRNRWTINRQDKKYTDKKQTWFGN